MRSPAPQPKLRAGRQRTGQRLRRMKEQSRSASMDAIVKWMHGNAAFRVPETVRSLQAAIFDPNRAHLFTVASANAALDATIDATVNKESS